MEIHSLYRIIAYSQFIFIFVHSSLAQEPRPKIECGCQKYGDYVAPASKALLIDMGESVQEAFSSEKDPRYKLIAQEAQYPFLTHISIYTGDNQIYSENTHAYGWGFSPDQDKFAMFGFDQNGKHYCTLVNLNPDPSIEGEQALTVLQIDPADVSSVNIRFSPHGKYLLYAAVSNLTLGLILHVYDTKTGELVYNGSSNMLTGSSTGKSIGGWGFSPDSRDATFVHAYKTDIYKYTLVVKNLKSDAGKYVAFAEDIEGEARWSFSPCGDYFGWIIDSPRDGLNCRLYKTNSENDYSTVSAVRWWKLYSKADGHYIKYIDNTETRITDNTADDECPDKERPEWTEDKMLDTNLVQGVRLQLEWEGDSDYYGVTSYKIFVSDVQGQPLKEYLYDELDKENPVKKYTVTGLNPQTEYIFRVEAGDDAGYWSNDGPEEKFSTFADYPPYWLDQTLKHKNETETKVTLYWDEPAIDDFGIMHYEIITNFEEDTLIRVGGDVSECTIKKLTPEKEYTFRIEAIDEAGQRAGGSAHRMTMPNREAPEWPVGASLTCSDSTETSLRVNWPEASDYYNEVKKYAVFMEDNPLKTVDKWTRYYEVGDLEEGTAYNFSVIAYDESDNPSLPLTGLLSTIPTFTADTLFSGPGNQKTPDIDGNQVVWWDDRNDDGDIYSCDLETDEIKRITDNAQIQYEPAVSNGRIVWADRRNGNMDIYMCDTTGAEVAVCKATGDQDMPAIDGNYIVWRDSRNGNFDIYLYDIKEKKEVAVSTRSSNQNWPDISGDFIVYSDDRNGNWDIYMYNIYLKKEIAICSNSADQTYPSISGKWLTDLAIAYMDNRNGDNIYIYYPDFAGGVDFEYLVPLDAQSQTSTQAYPALADNQLVYQDNYDVAYGDAWSIYAYQFVTGIPGAGDKKKAISSNPETSQTKPRTSKGNIIWEYEHDGDYDIHIWRRPPGSDLSLTLTEETDPVASMDTLTYVLEITNKGPNYNKNVITAVKIPLMAKYISSSADKGTITEEGVNITWLIDKLSSEESATMKIKMLTLEETILEFTAETGGKAFEPDPSNNKIKATTKVKNVFPRSVSEGDTPAMVVESDGKTHLAYFNNDTLFYAFKNRSEKLWQFNRLAYCACNYNIAMTMTPDRNIHIVYSGYNFNWDPETKGWLYHGVLTPSGEWTSKVISVSRVEYSNLAIDATTDGELYLAWIRGGMMGPVMIRRTSGGIWQEEKLIHSQGYDYVDLDVDQENNVHISFYNLSEGGILYRFWSGNLAGPVEKIESDWAGGQMEAMVTGVTTDNLNRPVVSYAGNINQDHNEHLKYALKTDGKWRSGKVDEGSFGSSANKVAIDPSGALNFGYIHHPTGQLRYSSNIAGPWTRQNIDENYGFLPDLRMNVDNEGYGHIAIPGIKYILIPPMIYFNIEPDSLDFGAVEKDTEKTIPVIITNPSDKDISINDITINDPRFSFSKTSFILLGYGADTVKITFTQSEEKGIETSMRFFYNSPSGMMMEIPVKARNAGPALSVDLEYVDFGPVPLYSLASKTVTLSNIGSRNLEFPTINIRREQIPGIPVPTDFNLTEGHTCVTLSPGGSCELTITFEPRTEGVQYNYLNIYSNDPEIPLYKIYVTGTTTSPYIFTDQTSLDLGYCETGKSAEKTLILRNTGSAILTINEMSLSGANANQFSFTNCTSIMPGESCPVTVTMSPTTEGDVTATLTIKSNSSSYYTKTLNIPLTGSSRTRKLALSTDLIKFGEVNIGESREAVLILNNAGSNDITFNGIILTGIDPYEFSYYDECHTIAPGASCNIQVKFKPYFEGSKTANLKVLSNDSFNPEQTVILSGTTGEFTPLTAEINANPQLGEEPLTVEFGAVPSGGQAPYSFLWDFNDMHISTEKSTEHEFTSTGSYMVSLTVTDIMGRKTTATTEILVAAEGAPIVVIHAQPAYGEIPLAVQFTADVTGGDTPLIFSWDFGDGQNSTQQNPLHSYTLPGTYLAKVTVTDTNSDTGTDAQQIIAIWNNSVSGDIWNKTMSAHIDKADVILYTPGNLTDTVQLSLNGTYTYHFRGLEAGSYTVKVIPDPVKYAGHFPTYLGDKLVLYDALFNDVTGHITGKDIHVITIPVIGDGVGAIRGEMITGTKKGVVVTEKTENIKGDPVADTYVYLTGSTDGELKAYDITESDGSFEFTNLLNGSYTFITDYQGKPMDVSNTPLIISDSRKEIKILATVGTNMITVKDVATGINTMINDVIKVYPVPAADILFIEIPLYLFKTNTVRMRVIDLLGRCILINDNITINGSLISLHLDQLRSGIYLLEFTDKTTCHSIKFVKMH